MLAYIAAGKLNSEEAAPREDVPDPKEITLALDDRTKQFIHDAELHFDELVGQHDMEVNSLSFRLVNKHDK